MKTELSAGHLLAALLSWTTHQDILWAVINGMFSWFYVLYWAFTYWK